MASPSELVSLRNECAFPDFKRISSDFELPPDDDFYDLSSERPIFHWCLLGQVMQIIYFGRLRLDVKDKAGKSLVVAFYTDRDYHHPQLRVGSTIAILHPRQHYFMDGSVGIRLEAWDNVKIFPMALDEMLRLSDRVQQYATEDNGEKACQGCDRKSSSLSRCAKCTLFSYCDRDCQAVAWNEKGHKADCKVLRDADFQGLLRLDWEVFDDYHRFSVDPRAE
ncbi:hypothetical protein G6O67_003329 [Ophiocordyceps sinensis]|uniref:MYND-type domain-containing protein n=1 Tax=Ophiocordyceps sinensis TaxID=72228 RepID=A0A8H4PW87_9HYPO|nr:hypothetical protein G6O67_003329 [Ophiocordyceps sinensis]